MLDHPLYLKNVALCEGEHIIDLLGWLSSAPRVGVLAPQEQTDAVDDRGLARAVGPVQEQGRGQIYRGAVRALEAGDLDALDSHASPPARRTANKRAASAGRSEQRVRIPKAVGAFVARISW